MSESEMKEPEKSIDNSGEKQQENTENRLQQESLTASTDTSAAARQRSEQTKGFVEKGVLPGLSFSDHEEVAKDLSPDATKEAQPGESTDSRNPNKDLADQKGDQKSGTQNKDGASVTSFEDGSQIAKDKNGLPTEISSSPNGDGKQLKIKVEYEGKQPKSVDIGGKIHLSKNSDGNWDMTNDLDGTTSKNAAENVSIDRKTGAISIDWKDGATKSGATSTEISRNFDLKSRFADGKEKEGFMPEMENAEKNGELGALEKSANILSNALLRKEGKPVDREMIDMAKDAISKAGRRGEQLKDRVNQKLAEEGSETRVVIENGRTQIFRSSR